MAMQKVIAKSRQIQNNNEIDSIRYDEIVSPNGLSEISHMEDAIFASALQDYYPDLKSIGKSNNQAEA